MTNNVTAPLNINAMSAPVQMQAALQDQMPPDIAAYDLHRFEQAIAALENGEAENKARVSQMLSPDAKITPTTVMAFNAALEERNISYSFARQMISAPSQWIKELTSMQ